MFYIIGLFRRTALWGIILIITGSIAIGKEKLIHMLLPVIGIYILFVLLHLLLCKITKSDNTALESYFSALGYDLVAPFSDFGLFIAVLFKKWVIHDDSKFHNFIDGFQVLIGGIWSVAVLGSAIYFIANIVL